MLVDTLDHHTQFAVSVTEGEVSFTLKASPEIAPVVQVVAYTVLPSETVIAHSADFSTEKCFSNKVSEKRKRHMESHLSLTDLGSELSVWSNT